MKKAVEGDTETVTPRQSLTSALVQLRWPTIDCFLS